MPIGRPAAGPAAVSGLRSTRGFTYLGLLFLVAAGAAALATLGPRWGTAVQRDKEQELIFRGHQIARAITAYRAAPGTDGKPQWPRQLEELVEDRRGIKPRHHLRRLYTDPFTGQPDWVLLTAADGSLRGVRSRSEVPAFITDGIDAAAPDRPLRVSDRRFMATAPTPGPAPAKPAASAPAAGPPSLRPGAR